MNDFDKKLDFDSNTFENMKHDMNFVLQRLLGNMIEKQSNEGSMTIKIDVRVIDPETGEGQYFICGGIDTCDETRVGEFIGTVGAVLFIVLAPIMFIAGIVALIVFGI